jgi:hypothetical protein
MIRIAATSRRGFSCELLRSRVGGGYVTPMATSTPTSTTTQTPKSFTRFFPPAARILFGLIFAFAGVTGLLMSLHITPPPAPTTPQPAGAMEFFGAMMKTGYLFTLVKATESVVGIMLLSNRFVPLALALIAPVVVNIFLFHAFLAPSGVPLAAVVLALEIYLAYSYRASYRSMLVMKATR